ncbi:spore germination protein [Bacillus sp. EB600]|uniref:spore germination protein n=1 Tax=Bacillus sp. EB600 TaxID=2806345 RepID=UPI00210A9E3A|nr:spore germination protein [Bacillus sp. EB600]MCQ6282796.1 spore germination protein [Bacillus sp. EB600]
MPAVVGVLQIVNINGNGIAEIQTKTYSGFEGFNTRGITVANNGVIGTNVLDLNLMNSLK